MARIVEAIGLYRTGKVTRAVATEAPQRLGERTAEALAADRTRFLAVTRACERIGEAAAQVARPVRDALNAIPSGPAITMGSRLIHGHGGIHAEIVEDAIHQGFPPLIAALDLALATTPPDGNPGYR
jgi:uncharacterized protein with HEPN domain